MESRRYRSNDFMPETALSQPQIKRNAGAGCGVFRGPHGCALSRYTFGPVPATPLSRTFVPRTGGFASVPRGTFALIENLIDPILTRIRRSTRRSAPAAAETVTRSRPEEQITPVEEPRAASLRSSRARSRSATGKDVMVGGPPQSRGRYLLSRRLRATPPCAAHADEQDLHRDGSRRTGTRLFYFAPANRDRGTPPT